MIRKQGARSIGQGEQLKLVATISGRCGGFASAPMLSMERCKWRGLFISKTATASAVVATGWRTEPLFPLSISEHWHFIFISFFYHLLKKTPLCSFALSAPSWNYTTLKSEDIQKNFRFLYFSRKWHLERCLSRNTDQPILQHISQYLKLKACRLH